MDIKLRQEIEGLKKAIKAEEERVAQATQNSDNDVVSKSLAAIDSDLKYLSIVINGAPIEKKLDRKTREFLRIHLENLWKLSLPA